MVVATPGRLGRRRHQRLTTALRQLFAMIAAMVTVAGLTVAGAAAVV